MKVIPPGVRYAWMDSATDYIYDETVMLRSIALHRRLWFHIAMFILRIAGLYGQKVWVRLKWRRIRS